MVDHLTCISRVNEPVSLATENVGHNNTTLTIGIGPLPPPEFQTLLLSCHVNTTLRVGYTAPQLTSSMTSSHLHWLWAHFDFSHLLRKKTIISPKKNIEICCVYFSASTMACVEEYIDGRQLKFPTILRSLKKRLNCHHAFYLFYPLTKNNHIFFDALIYIFPGHFFPPKANVCGWLTSKSIDIVVLPSFFIFFTLLLKEIFRHAQDALVILFL